MCHKKMLGLLNSINDDYSFLLNACVFQQFLLIFKWYKKSLIRSNFNK